MSGEKVIGMYWTDGKSNWGRAYATDFRCIRMGLYANKLAARVPRKRARRINGRLQKRVPFTPPGFSCMKKLAAAWIQGGKRDA